MKVLFLAFALVATIAASPLAPKSNLHEFGSMLTDFLARRQEQASAYTPGQANYKCSAQQMAKSASSPTNVHAVRPADIKIVGAIGDSLTAANGAKASKVGGVKTMFRGVSFSIGGDDALEQTVTVPNVLRKYNSGLFGQSHGEGSAQDWDVAHLNVAVPGSTARDLPAQAIDIVHRMRNHSEINFYDDWKLITIFYGGNDLCAYCNHPDEYSPTAMATNLKEVLRTLSYVPKTIVQLVGMFHLEMLRQVGHHELTCEIMHTLECPCSVDPFFTNGDFSKIVGQYQDEQMKIQVDGEFERPDFTFVVQGAVEHVVTAPMLNGKVDLSFFAPDCFHFSQKGHNTVARILWSNMMQPIGQKLTHYNMSDSAFPIACPDDACPFIRTTGNSNAEQCSQLVSAFPPSKESLLTKLA